MSLNLGTHKKKSIQLDTKSRVIRGNHIFLFCYKINFHFCFIFDSHTCLLCFSKQSLIGSLIGAWTFLCAQEAFEREICANVVNINRFSFIPNQRSIPALASSLFWRKRSYNFYLQHILITIRHRRPVLSDR